MTNSPATQYEIQIALAMSESATARYVLDHLFGLTKAELMITSDGLGGIAKKSWNKARIRETIRAHYQVIVDKYDAIISEAHKAIEALTVRVSHTFRDMVPAQPTRKKAYGFGS